MRIVQELIGFKQGNLNMLMTAVTSLGCAWKGSQALGSTIG